MARVPGCWSGGEAVPESRGPPGGEWALVAGANVPRGLVDTLAVLYRQLQNLDFRHDVPGPKVPVFPLDGTADRRGRRDLALEWFGKLDAPVKEVFSFTGPARSVAFEQAGRLPQILRDEVRPVALD
ncbi:MAG TPA: hypothetical protein VHN99_10575 [Deinococcales bacterium]|nr:hypothetical protein [Deinococcales bacterium]